MFAVDPASLELLRVCEECQHSLPLHQIPAKTWKKRGTRGLVGGAAARARDMCGPIELSPLASSGLT